MLKQSSSTHNNGPVNLRGVPTVHQPGLFVDVRNSRGAVRVSLLW